MLTRDVVGSQVGLLDMLQFLSCFGEHCRTPTPLVVDINIHYRIQKLLFNRAYAQWNV